MMGSQDKIKIPNTMPLFQHGRPIRKAILMETSNQIATTLVFELEKDDISLMYLDTELSKLIILYTGGIFEIVNLKKVFKFKFEFVEENMGGG